VSTERILVTGGNGRLGRAVLQQLGGRGVAGVRRPDAAKGAILIDANGATAPRALDGITAIINCAGRTAGAHDAINQANIIYPTRLAESARAAGVRRFVQVSSFSIFGRTEHIGPDSPYAPAGQYGRSKLAAEQVLTTLDSAEFRTVPLRLPFMFSAEEPALLGRLVTMMLRLRALPTLAAKPSRRSMITYAGAADILIALAQAPDIPRRGLAAADPEPLALPTIARLIGERLDRRIAIVPIPRAAVALAAMAFPLLVDRLFGSSILAPSANLAASSGAHSVEAELARYLDRLADCPLSGQYPGN